MHKFLRRCWKTDKGLAAIEFAFVLPILLTMLLGLVELSQAMSLRADVVNMASTGADLIAQETTVGAGDMTNVFNALGAMVYPFDSGPATITLTSVIDGGTGKAPKVAWSCTKGGALETKGAAPSVALPTGLITPGDGSSVIWSKITYAFNSPISYFLVGTQNWTNNFYLKPRRVLQIPITAGTAGCNT
jgi:Flp pilus assembly protein TadG